MRQRAHWPSAQLRAGELRASDISLQNDHTPNFNH
jgi:hypothetical protein